jgi:bifunctional DNA-binding transcriptional regulator/antitoxin component of YhaV-PrlF toxin-antitoxin module
MTGSVIPPVIPPRRRPDPAAGRPGGTRPVPLAIPFFPAVPRPPDAVYGTGRVDASGRVAERAVTESLGWRGGDRLTITASEGVVIARRDPLGMVTLPARACIVIPSAVRRRCGLRPGDMVLLAALPGQDALAAYPLAVVDRALRACAPLPGTEGARS